LLEPSPKHIQPTLARLKLNNYPRLILTIWVLTGKTISNFVKGVAQKQSTDRQWWSNALVQTHWATWNCTRISVLVKQK